MRNSDFLKQTLPEPKRPEFLPKSAQWLAGEGAGSWFYIETTSNNDFYEITRFSPKGKVECKGNFETENTNNKLDLNKSYEFVHLSHCAFVNIEQGGVIFKLIRKKMHHGGTEDTEL